MDASRETLLALLTLQKMDSALDRLEYRRRNLPEQAELDELETRLAAVEKALGEAQNRADDCASRQKKLDGEIDSLSRKIESEEARLFAGKVSSPKELAALQSEIDYLKNRKNSVEEDDLLVMEEREEVDKLLHALEAEEKSLRASVEDQTTRRDSAVSLLLSEKDGLANERGTWAGKFDAELLSIYDDLRSSKGGIAIAALENGTCQGCHMKLPAQDVTRIRRTEGLVKCVECGRLLVVG